MYISALLFFFTFFFYLRTHCATFNINDSGETIMVCDLMTISHSPGYPLHTLLGRVFCLFPVGQPMFRVTLFSMVTGAASVVVLYWILRACVKTSLEATGAQGDLVDQEKGPKAWLYEGPALFGALCFGFSYQHWFQVDGAKGGIYALNTFISLVILFLFFKMRENGWFVKSFLLIGFFYHLGLAHHWPNMGVMAPAFLWFLINSQKRVPVAEFFKMVFNPVYIFIVLLVGVVFFLAIGSFTLAVAATSYVIAALITIRIFGRLHFIRSFTFSLLGLSVYLYLPFRAIQKPIVNWWNPQTWNMLFGTVLRKGYQGMGENRSLITYTRNFNRFWLHAHHQYGDYFTYFILALSLWGVYWLFRKQSSSAIGFFFLGSIVFTSILVFNNPLEGYQWTLDNFFTPVFMVIAFFAAAGLAALCEAADKEWSALPLRAAGGGVCLGLGLLPLVLNYTAGDRHLKNGQPVYECNNQSRYVSSYDYGVNMLKTAKDNSVILCNGDIDILPLWYLQFVLGKRPSVTSFTMQLIPYDWYREPLFNRWPFLRVPLRLDAYGHPDIRPETVVQDMITQHAKDKSFYYTNIFTAQWLRDTKWLQEHPENMAIPEGFLWRIVNTKDMNYAFTSGLLNQYWSTYRLRYMEEPERGYWDEYTDVMKDSYGIGYDFTGYFAFQNNMADIALLCFSNALKYRQAQTLGRIHMMLGETYLKLKNPFAALNSFQELMKREPNATPFAYAKMGDAFLQMNDLPNAEQAFRNSLSINPQQPEAIQGMQALSQVQGKAAAGTKR